ncbi:winged helix-turn-helix transcriptional regulator [Streptomyces sp. 205]|uniref:Winged helix-turn-helix transcriptional regulator n=2 Tax=Streptomyces coffeae TaxID=621382 RepID=A0ABS1NC05_9ACTN|nr:winged helix-turn-helix transcriptional regulator [Streptomyces coffeae]
MWETMLSLHSLRQQNGGLVPAQWRRSVGPKLPRSTGLLTALVPSKGYFPDFLTPATPLYDADEGLDAVLSTPRARLRRDLTLLAGGQRLPPWTRSLAEGDGDALALLGRAIEAYHEAAIAPYWERIRAQVDHERLRVSTPMLSGGTEALLSALPPCLRWRRPVLEADYPVDRDLRLGGRGLLLIPSFFCRRTSITLLHQDRTPVLVYPVQHRLLDEGPAAQGRPSLAKLLGPTRAAVLEAAEGSCTTGELARRVGILVSSASQHATVLRNAGLLTSKRVGNTVVHSRTPLGSQLLYRGTVPPTLTEPGR